MLLLSRVVIGLIFIYHGFPKIISPEGPMQFFSSLGLPGSLAIVVGILEVVAGILLFVGLWYKGASYTLVVIIAGALVLVQIPGVFKAGDITTGFERDLLILIATLLLASHGPGHLSFSRKRKN
jgi:putative oxidoreductase